MTRYKCPLCGTTLNRARYEEVLRVLEERDRVAQAQIEDAHAAKSPYPCQHEHV